MIQIGHDCKRRAIRIQSVGFSLVCWYYYIKANNFRVAMSVLCCFACKTVCDIGSWRVRSAYLRLTRSVSKCHHPSQNPVWASLIAPLSIDSMRMRPIKHNGFLIRIKARSGCIIRAKQKLNGRLSIFVRFSFHNKWHETANQKPSTKWRTRLGREKRPFFLSRWTTKKRRRERHTGRNSQTNWRIKLDKSNKVRNVLFILKKNLL